MFLLRFNLSFRSDHDTSAACLVCLFHAGISINSAARWEIRRLDVAHQFLYCDFRIVKKSNRSVDCLREVVRRHIGRHTHSDTRGSVYEQVRETRRQHCRLLQSVVEVWHKVYSILVNVTEHFLANLRKTCLRVTHCRRRVAVERAEVTLSEHKRIAQRPVLCHSRQREVNRRVAVWVKLTHNLTYDTRTFLCRLVGRVSKSLHSKQHTPVHGLETVPHIRHRARHYHRH